MHWLDASYLQLHGVAKEMALRLKNENAPQHARSLLDSDTRLQAEYANRILRILSVALVP